MNFRTAEQERQRGLYDEELVLNWLRRDAETHRRMFKKSDTRENIELDIDAFSGGTTFSIKVQDPIYENFAFELYTDYFDLRPRRKGWWETGKAEYYLYVAGPKQILYIIKKADVKALVDREGWPVKKSTSKAVQEREGKVTYNGLVPIARFVRDRFAIPVARKVDWRPSSDPPPRR